MRSDVSVDRDVARELKGVLIIALSLPAEERPGPGREPVSNQLAA
jgi:hypothetical protein